MCWVSVLRGGSHVAAYNTTSLICTCLSFTRKITRNSVLLANSQKDTKQPQVVVAATAQWYCWSVAVVAAAATRLAYLILSSSDEAVGVFF